MVILIHVSCIMLNYQVAIRFLAIKCFSYDFDFNRFSYLKIYSRDRSSRVFL
jgi:hypothetical protein